jgi:hypothetical protein
MNITERLDNIFSMLVELNPLNYDHEDVVAQNNSVIAACTEIQRLLTEMNGNP